MGVCRPPLAPRADAATQARIREVLLETGALHESDLVEAA